MLSFRAPQQLPLLDDLSRSYRSYRVTFDIVAKDTVSRWVSMEQPGQNPHWKSAIQLLPASDQCDIPLTYFVPLLVYVLSERDTTNLLVAVASEVPYEQNIGCSMPGPWESSSAPS